MEKIINNKFDDADKEDLDKLIKLINSNNNYDNEFNEILNTVLKNYLLNNVLNNLLIVENNNFLNILNDSWKNFNDKLCKIVNNFKRCNYLHLNFNKNYDKFGIEEFKFYILDDILIRFVIMNIF